MADKKDSGGDGLSIGSILLIGMLILFAMWFTSGGPERIENKYNPFIEPLVEPLGDGSVYGEGGRLQTGVEEIIQDGIYVGWRINLRKSFSFLTPPNWSSSVRGEFDGTEFGEITNGDITLLYQYGRDANQLDFENDPDYLVEYGTVNGRWARFVKPRNDFAETTGAFIKRSKRKRITIYTNQELSEEETRQVFEIINTIKI